MVEHLTNDTKTWMFGTTSEFSKEIIKNLDNPICFGRHNVDYDDPDKFIKEHVVDNTPVNMVINVNLNNNTMLSTDSMQTLSGYKKYFMNITANIFFFFRLLDEMNTLKIPVRVCYITSTFANTRWYVGEAVNNAMEDLKMRPNIYVNNLKKDKDHVFKYASVRLIQQSAMNSNISETCRVIGVSPARLEEDDNITLYALRISEMVNKPFDDEQWNRVHCLSGPIIYSQPLWEEE